MAMLGRQAMQQLLVMLLQLVPVKQLRDWKSALTSEAIDNCAQRHRIN